METRRPRSVEGEAGTTSQAQLATTTSRSARQQERRRDQRQGTWSGRSDHDDSERHGGGGKSIVVGDDTVQVISKVDRRCEVQGVQAAKQVRLEGARSLEQRGGEGEKDERVQHRSRLLHLVGGASGLENGADTFILRQAERHGLTVVSNDSFAHAWDDHPWLRDPGRLRGASLLLGTWDFPERKPSRPRP